MYKSITFGMCVLDGRPRTSTVARISLWEYGKLVGLDQDLKKYLAFERDFMAHCLL
jgi:hypothetical protein